MFFRFKMLPHFYFFLDLYLRNFETLQAKNFKLAVLKTFHICWLFFNCKHQANVFLCFVSKNVSKRFPNNKKYYQGFRDVDCIKQCTIIFHYLHIHFPWMHAFHAIQIKKHQQYILYVIWTLLSETFAKKVQIFSTDILCLHRSNISQKTKMIAKKKIEA